VVCKTCFDLIVLATDGDPNKAGALIRELVQVHCRHLESDAHNVQVQAMLPARVAFFALAHPHPRTRKLYRARAPVGVPAVALTAYAQGQDRKPALSAGFQVHLAKPIEPETLIAAVAQLVELEAGPVCVLHHSGAVRAQWMQASHRALSAAREVLRPLLVDELRRRLGLTWPG